MRYWVSDDEEYPIFTIHENKEDSFWSSEEVDLPEDLTNEYTATKTKFFELRDKIRVLAEKAWKERNIHNYMEETKRRVDERKRTD